jgi:uncharacterized protein
MNQQFEVRYTSEIRASEEGKLVGYAVRYHAPSLDLGGFREIVLPGAFERTLREYPDVLALVEHDTNRVLARTSNRTLRIIPDETGLKVEIDPADTSYARDILALVRRGDVAGMSFRFRPFEGGASMDMTTSPPTRYLRGVQLSEVSVVVSPAYPDTSVAVRDLERARAEIETGRHAARRMRLRLAEVQ